MKWRDFADPLNLYIPKPIQASGSFGTVSVLVLVLMTSHFFFLLMKTSSLLSPLSPFSILKVVTQRKTNEINTLFNPSA